MSCNLFRASGNADPPAAGHEIYLAEGVQMKKAIFNSVTIQLTAAVLITVSSAMSLAAQSKAGEIDVEHSSMTIHVSKTGMFSFAGDNHEIHAPIFSGTVNETAKTVEFKVESSNLTVLDPNL